VGRSRWSLDIRRCVCAAMVPNAIRERVQAALGYGLERCYESEDICLRYHLAGMLGRVHELYKINRLLAKSAR